MIFLVLFGCLCCCQKSNLVKEVRMEWRANRKQSGRNPCRFQDLLSLCDTKNRISFTIRIQKFRWERGARTKWRNLTFEKKKKMNTEKAKNITNSAMLQLKVAKRPMKLAINFPRL